MRLLDHYIVLSLRGRYFEVFWNRSRESFWYHISNELYLLTSPGQGAFSALPELALLILTLSLLLLSKIFI